MSVYNVTETMVRSLLEDAYLKRGLVRCGCSRCIDDILAIALNHLPSHYVSTEHGITFIKAKYFEPQLQSDVLRELAIAVDTVARRPRHTIPVEEDPGSPSGTTPA
ncbi:late competence development ComFB family protein [Alicyclobacillus sp.]|uniref:late competence development ComFB family protein n=1 Tax=Alicyclobacillus sp. TaxID=61169 RepID=UPI0025C43C6B|nr:late competence development ComFB family protein [Alicyclobacillus sp.]MCL6517234.1 late competence development ComFB family protein [Alicyclobacillus sp.]